MQVRLLNRLLTSIVCVAAATAGFASVAQAEDFPSKPIRIIVPYGAGGGSDYLARRLSDKLAQRLGQTVIVENRPGADGIIGTNMVARADPDGYTYLIAVGTHLLNPLVHKDLPYDTFGDLTGVTMIARSPLLFSASNSIKARDMTDFVKLAHENPGKYSFANSEKFTMMLVKMLTDSQKMDVVHVPYKGSGPLLVDVAGGAVSIASSSIAAAMPYLKSNRLHPLAVTGLERTSALPDVPTLKELGLGDFDYYVTYGLYAPAKTPRAALERMQQEVRNVTSDPEMKEALNSQAAEPVANGVDEFNAEQAEYFERIKALATKFNLKPD